MIDTFTRKIEIAGGSAIVLALSLIVAPAGADDDKDKDNDRTVAFADIFGCRDEGFLGRAVLVDSTSTRPTAPSV